ncbi:hypothetical protein KJ765_02945 [Candidatus Micrarchaeota archaeon]|nr:hypothetical protein [Candidatus Micrarchaeota archaeon]
MSHIERATIEEAFINNIINQFLGGSSFPLGEGVIAPDVDPVHSRYGFVCPSLFWMIISMRLSSAIPAETLQTARAIPTNFFR